MSIFGAAGGFVPEIDPWNATGEEVVNSGKQAVNATTTGTAPKPMHSSTTHNKAPPEQEVGEPLKKIGKDGKVEGGKPMITKETLKKPYVWVAIGVAAIFVLQKII